LKNKNQYAGSKAPRDPTKDAEDKENGSKKKGGKKKEEDKPTPKPEDEPAHPKTVDLLGMDDEIFAIANKQGLPPKAGETPGGEATKTLQDIFSKDFYQNLKSVRNADKPGVQFPGWDTPGQPTPAAPAKPAEATAVPMPWPGAHVGAPVAGPYPIMPQGYGAFPQNPFAGGQYVVPPNAAMPYGQNNPFANQFGFGPVMAGQGVYPQYPGMMPQHPGMTVGVGAQPQGNGGQAPQQKITMHGTAPAKAPAATVTVQPNVPAPLSIHNGQVQAPQEKPKEQKK
jgi:hypothetical protein